MNALKPIKADVSLWFQTSRRLSDVYGVAQRAQSRLVIGLTQSGVNMDGPCHIFEQCPHFQRMAEFTRQFRDMRTDRLDAKDPVIGL